MATSLLKIVPPKWGQAVYQLPAAIPNHLRLLRAMGLQLACGSYSNSGKNNLISKQPTPARIFVTIPVPMWVSITLDNQQWVGPNCACVRRTPSNKEQVLKIVYSCMCGRDLTIMHLPFSSLELIGT